jgi:hypothetical protein
VDDLDAKIVDNHKAIWNALVVLTDHEPLVFDGDSNICGYCLAHDNPNPSVIHSDKCPYKLGRALRKLVEG